MKKFLMLLILCSLTSLTNAAVDIWLTNGQGQSSITLTPSQTVTLYAWYSGDEIIQQFDFEADVISGHGTILGGTITAGNRMTDYDGVPMPGILEGDIELVGGRDDNGAVYTGMNPPLAMIQFHCDGEGVVVIDLYNVMTFDIDWTEIFPTYHGMTITQIIPEPATMLLLGLGGLLLRKK